MPSCEYNGPITDPRDFFFFLWYAAMYKVNIEEQEMTRLKQTKVRKSCHERVHVSQIDEVLLCVRLRCAGMP